MRPDNNIAVVAIGGHSLIAGTKRRSIPEQFKAAATSAGYIAAMIKAGWQVVLTHGNGPQVGFILRRSEIAIDEVPPVPMDYATADTQGAIGYMFQKALRNEFRRRKIAKQAVTVVTQVLVDRDDPAFDHPTKPIGAFMDEQTAKQRAAQEGWLVKEEAGRGWRRVVSSPLPQAIIELDVIQTLVKAGYVVIACGGGGIPVIENRRGNLRGMEAVVDKDFASGLLAQGLGARLFLIATAVEKVALHFNQPNQQWLDRLTASEARAYEAEGHFAPGSMGPKIKAILDFLAAGGQQGLITDPPNIGRALAGDTGTLIVPD